MRFFSSVLLCFSVFILASCGVGNPNPMPRGYSAYDKPYKSVDGKDANDVGYAYSNSHNQEVQQEIVKIADDLVEKLDQKLSFGIDQIYLSPAHHGVFDKSMDHAVRTALVDRGYLLSPDPNDAVRLDVVVQKLDRKTCSCAETHDPHMLHISLATDIEEGVSADYVSGVYSFSQFKDVTLTRGVNIVPSHCGMSSGDSCGGSCAADDVSAGSQHCSRP